MEITTSQSKTPVIANEPQAEPQKEPMSRVLSGHDDDRYIDRSDDLVTRVRAAREAAQRKMDAFGNVADYNVRMVRGRKGTSRP